VDAKQAGGSDYQRESRVSSGWEREEGRQPQEFKSEDQLSMKLEVKHLCPVSDAVRMEAEP
jgi:hypothetical protein